MGRHENIAKAVYALELYTSNNDSDEPDADNNYDGYQ